MCFVFGRLVQYQCRRLYFFPFRHTKVNLTLFTNFLLILNERRLFYSIVYLRKERERKREKKDLKDIKNYII